MALILNSVTAIDLLVTDVETTTAHYKHTDPYCSCRSRGEHRDGGTVPVGWNLHEGSCWEEPPGLTRAPTALAGSSQPRAAPGTSVPADATAGA